MKYLKLFEEEVWLNDKITNYRKRKDINKICKEYNIKNYTINTDGSIDVDGNVHLYNNGLTKLPLKFNKVNGHFDCGDNQLTSLEGSPVEMDGDFYCYNNELTSFKYAPKIIRGFFDCGNNNIKSFEYFPSFVKYNFWCTNNPIYQVWLLFYDWTKIELLNDFDIFRDEDTDTPSIFIERLNDFLEMIGKNPVKKVEGYKNI